MDVLHPGAKVFVFDAGKVIMIISLVLWAFSSFGPTEKRNKIKENYAILIKNDPVNENKYQAEKSSALSRSILIMATSWALRQASGRVLPDSNAVRAVATT